MTVREPKHDIIPLSEAYLCSDCEAIGRQSRNCIACGSSAVFALERFIPSLGTETTSRVLKTAPEPEKTPDGAFYRPIGLQTSY